MPRPFRPRSFRSVLCRNLGLARPHRLLSATGGPALAAASCFLPLADLILRGHVLSATGGPAQAATACSPPPPGPVPTAATYSPPPQDLPRRSACSLPPTDLRRPQPRTRRHLPDPRRLQPCSPPPAGPARAASACSPPPGPAGRSHLTPTSARIATWLPKHPGVARAGHRQPLCLSGAPAAWRLQRHFLTVFSRPTLREPILGSACRAKIAAVAGDHDTYVRQGQFVTATAGRGRTDSDHRGHSWPGPVRGRAALDRRGTPSGPAAVSRARAPWPEVIHNPPVIHR